jgi:hypothetical protein
MKTIKYRAWTDQGTFGKFRMEKSVGILPLESSNEWSDSPHGLLLKPGGRHILMQFTGLKDKNGRDIYEGDVVTFNSYDEAGIVEWHKEYAMFNVEHKNCLSGAMQTNPNKYKVIGNVHENPELLK